ncbi:MAG TPA: hypothetical protein VJR26_10110 [Candidatus Acidoferrales bacterium]|nr:hypothetical protein [Candidatus Acidoferrales bacterium]
MPVCDGCGEHVDEMHIRRRIERLELATRFRPVHIAILLIDTAPPTRPEDFFYAASTDDRPSVTARAYFDELAKLSGCTGGSSPQAGVVLAEFQRRGFFLTSAIECPVDDAVGLSVAARKLAPTLLRRVRSSYKPKYVALISAPTKELIGPLQANGWRDRLILDDGAPFALESIAARLGDAVARMG